MTIIVRNDLKLRDIRRSEVIIYTISLYCDFLITEGFVWEASRMFALACQLASEFVVHGFDDHEHPNIHERLMRRIGGDVPDPYKKLMHWTKRGLPEIYEKLMRQIEDDLLLKANDIDGKAGELLTSVHAKMSFAKMLWAYQEKQPGFMLAGRFRYKYDFSEIYKAATERLRMVFQLLPDPSMRGEYADNLRSPNPANPHPVARALTQSTIEPRPAKRDNPKLSHEPRKSNQPSAWLADRSDQSGNLHITDEASERQRKALSRSMPPTWSPKALHSTELPPSHTLPFESAHEAATGEAPHPEKEQKQSQKRGYSNDSSKAPPPPPRPFRNSDILAATGNPFIDSVLETQGNYTISQAQYEENRRRATGEEYFSSRRKDRT